MVHPAEINDPQFEVIRVLYFTEDFSIAAGRWEGGDVCIGLRWNGVGERLGYPVGRHRQPKFLVLPEELTIPLLGMLATANPSGTIMGAVVGSLAEMHRQNGVRVSEGARGADFRHHPDEVNEMSQRVLDSATGRRTVERLESLLKAFHEAEAKNEGGFESVSRRGQLGGFRHALEIVAGREDTSAILAAVREATGLQFPHVGPVADDGTISGFDSEAALGL